MINLSYMLVTSIFLDKNVFQANASLENIHWCFLKLQQSYKKIVIFKVEHNAVGMYGGFSGV